MVQRTGHSLADRVSSANFEWPTTGMPLVNEMVPMARKYPLAWGAHSCPQMPECRTWLTLIVNDLRVSRASTTADWQGLQGSQGSQGSKVRGFQGLRALPMQAWLPCSGGLWRLLRDGGTTRADLLLPNARVPTPCRLCSSCFVVESKVVCGGFESSVRLTTSRMTLL